jgi:CubicO group peptidase (beta-lactamase class C family)
MERGSRGFSAIYPTEEWQTRKPEEMGFDPEALVAILPKNGIGGAIIRSGYLVATWGNPDQSFQTASLGKSITTTVLGLAVDARLVELDEAVHKTWTGERELSNEFKWLSRGHQQEVTWRQLATMTAGFTNNDDPAIGEGDITTNYAQMPPGKWRYSGGGMWRLAQLLTKLWDRDLLDVLVERIFEPIGVPARRVDWLAGGHVHDHPFYPPRKGYAGTYGGYLDPPYAIHGHVVRGGPGWVVLNAKDAARFGYLFLQNGKWRDRQLISKEWVSLVQRSGPDPNFPYYSIGWRLSPRGIFQATGANVDVPNTYSWIAVAPHHDVVIAGIKTTETPIPPTWQGLTAGMDVPLDWNHKVLDTIVGDTPTDPIRAIHDTARLVKKRT